MMVDSRRRTVLWSLAGLGAVVGGVLLYFFAPAEHPFYPKCVFYLVTGLTCPGCGTLRAAHSLLHGDFAAAFRFNPLLFTLLPAIGLAWVVYRPASWSVVSPKWIWVLLGVIIGFGILRNLPVAPFKYWKVQAETVFSQRLVTSSATREKPHV